MTHPGGEVLAGKPRPLIGGALVLPGAALLP